MESRSCGRAENPDPIARHEIQTALRTQNTETENATQSLDSEALARVVGREDLAKLTTRRRLVKSSHPPISNLDKSYPVQSQLPQPYLQNITNSIWLL